MIFPSESSAVDFGGPINRPFELFPASALDRPIRERFVAVARRYSTRFAIIDRTTRLTYGALAAVVEQIAAATVITAADRPGPIAILLPNAAEFPAAMLGILAGGRGFVPLDAEHPDERNRLIATQSHAAAVVSAGPLAERVRSLFARNLPVIDIGALGDLARRPMIAAAAADDLAAIVYTSGSTGTPKGAYHSHRNLLHDVMQQTNTLHLDPTDRVSLLYSPAVIAAIREILITLLNGASLHILPPQRLRPSDLVQAIQQGGITICRTVPVLLRHIAAALPPDQRLDSVRVLGLGSQRVDWSDFDLFRRCCPEQAFLIVGIGSTECGGNYCHWYVDERTRTVGGRLPIGRILPDAGVTVADDDGCPVAAGEMGEFIVASRFLALGYWREPELTAAAFKTDAADPRTRIFRTGDMGRVRPDGLLEFCGRSDQQIKLRGHRIELGEIEFALSGCPGIQEAAVVVRRDAAGLPQSLAAYVETKPGAATPRSNDLRLLLLRQLPRHMIPAHIDVIEEVPRLANMKIDRVRLTQIDATRIAQRTARVDDPLLAEVIGIFETVLGDVGGVTPEDNVLSLGGDSLQAVAILVDLQDRFGIAIPVEVFETIETIRQLARWIEAQQVSAGRSPGA